MRVNNLAVDVTPRLGGSVTFSRVRVALPTVQGLRVLQRG